MREDEGKVAKMTNPAFSECFNRWAEMNTVAHTRERAQNTQSISQKEREYLVMGVMQPGGKLPLFDDRGQEISASTIKSCMKKGLAERWFANPLKPDWLVCRLTEKGCQAVR